MLTSRTFPYALVSFTLATVSLGLALQVADGFYKPAALTLLTIAIVFTVTGVCLIRSEPSGAQWSHGPAVMAAGVLIQLAVLFRAKPGMYLEEFAHLELFKLGVVLEAALVGAGVMGVGRLARSWFPAVLVLNLALGVWMLNASPDPHIDVLEVHEAALRALGRGRNPYQITFRNIYGPNSGLYNPAAVSGDRVLFGYPYPPMSLLVVAPGRLIFGDYRYAELAALVAGAAFIGYAGASVTARLAAVLLLTTPRGFFVLEQGWTEPVAVLMLGATLWSLMKRPAWSPWIGGLFVVTKQYLGLAGPLLWKTGAQYPQNAWGFLWRAGVAASLVTVPFALWNLRAFIDTVILLQTKEPFRIDSLSFVSWAARAGLGEGSFVWAAGAAAVALAFVLWRTPSTAAGFAGGLALTTLVTFSMGSKAFCNYYFFVVAALCAALAALDTSAEASGRA